MGVQPRFQSLFGTNVLGVVDDSEAYSIESRDPRFSRVVVKTGFNPLAPEGSVIMSKETNAQTGETMLVCGILADEVRKGQGMATDVKQQLTDLRDSGLFAEAEKLRQVRVDIAENPQGVLGDVGIKTVKLEPPTSPLDRERQISAEVAQIVTENASLAGTRSFEGQPAPEIRAADTWDFSSWEDLRWLLLIIVIVVVAVGGGIASFIYLRRREETGDSSADR